MGVSWPALSDDLRRGSTDLNERRSGRAVRARQRKLRRDLATLAAFIAIYCEERHEGAERRCVVLKTHDVDAIHGRPLRLCSECRNLLAHAFTKRTHCPFDPKPACKRCPLHCYAPKYREQIQRVMRYSGRRLALGGRLDCLFHLLF